MKKLGKLLTDSITKLARWELYDRVYCCGGGGGGC